MLLFDMGRAAVQCRVLGLSPQGLSVQDEQVMARPEPGSSPFYVEDADVSHGTVLLRDVWDPPLRSRWYIFDLGSRVLTEVRGTNDRAFFLAGDILAALRGRVKSPR